MIPYDPNHYSLIRLYYKGKDERLTVVKTVARQSAWFREDRYHVESSQHDGTYYVVSIIQPRSEAPIQLACSCPAGEHGFLCKHIALSLEKRGIFKEPPPLKLSEVFADV